MDIIKNHILQLYESIEEADHSYRVRFYETNAQLILSLDQAQQAYFTFHYLCSLFELGKYELVLSEIDTLIEYVFLNNIEYRSSGTFEELLFKKASSLHNTMRYQESIDISLQLIGMQPQKRLYQQLAENSYLSFFNLQSSGIRLVTIILIFGSSIVSAIFWLLNASYLNHSLLYTFLIVISPCLLALLILGGSYGINYLRSFLIVQKLVALKKSHKGLS